MYRFLLVIYNSKGYFLQMPKERELVLLFLAPSQSVFKSFNPNILSKNIFF